MNIGIGGARKYRHRQSVINMVTSIPAESMIITSSCKGLCAWVREEAERRGMEVILFTSDLLNVRAWFEIPKRYYQRNKQLVEACDLLYAFLSQEDGFTGGTRFEIEYAVRLGIPVQIHWEGGGSYAWYQYPFTFIEGGKDSPWRGRSLLIQRNYIKLQPCHCEEPWHTAGGGRRSFRE